MSDKQVDEGVAQVHALRHAARVQAVVPIAQGVRQVTLAHPEGGALPGFAPGAHIDVYLPQGCLLYTSPSPRDRQKSRMPSSA